MFTAIYYSFLIAFILPTFAQELRVKSANPEIDYSDEQWLLLRDAIFSHETQGLLDWDSKLDYLFPEIKSFETQTPIFDSLARTPNASKKPSRDTYRMCPLCGKLVSKISVHVRYHKDEYRYPCDQCPQMFKEACNLSKHKKRHAKKRTLESLSNPSAKRISKFKSSEAQATQQKDTQIKTADEIDQEDPEAYRNPELQASEYIPTESAQPVLGKLSLLGQVVSDTSKQRLARSLERLAQNPKQAAVLPNHLRLEFKVKKYTPTQPAIDPTTAQSCNGGGKHGNNPNLDLSNQKKFTCPHCSIAYKRKGFLEKHMALCVPQTPTGTPLPAVLCVAVDQALAQQPPAGTKHHLDDVLADDTQAVKKYKKNDQKFECTLCEKKYGRIGHLNKHLLSHYRGPKKPSVAHLEGIACTLCSKTFKYDRDYQNHMNAHTGQKPHVCTHCNKGFATRSNLTDHMRHYCRQ